MWKDLAACAGISTDLFFPPENIGGPREGRGVAGEKERVERAKKICERCPVRDECLEYSIDLGCVGIWGGMDTAERREYARKR
jgi:WhiB family transcriptional regulator, redox-sensing transcriptional regulator